MQKDDKELRFAFEHAAIGMVLMEPGTGRFIRVNPPFCELTGYCKDEILAMDFESIIHPDDSATGIRLRREALETGTSYRAEERYRRKDGREILVRVVAYPVFDEEGKATSLIGFVDDMSGLGKAAERRRRNEECRQSELEETSEGVWDWDIDSGRVFLSARWKEMLGFEDNELLNCVETWEQLVHPDDLAEAKAALECHLRGLTAIFRVEYRVRCRDGSYKWIMARGNAVRDAAGCPMRMAGTHSAITKRKKPEAQVVSNAEHIAAARVTGQPLCLAVCDIDRFTSVNDAFGRPAGDEVLMAFARLLRACQKVLAARLSGNQFRILLPNTTYNEATDLLRRVCERLAALRFTTDAGIEFNVTASAGVALLGPGMTRHALLAAADEALNVSRKRVRNHAQLCDEEQELIAAAF